MQLNLKAIRESFGWSYSEMAELLGLKRATYQGYETGRRATPPHVLKQAQESLDLERKRMKNRYKSGGEFDQIAARLHPCGIMSEVRG
jgi:transcriptional regulator with XRE-family HTH domain